MADKLSLLFRRGTINQILAGNQIVPGAVSFCTDEPGIYLDLTSEENGGKGPKRVRIGDFITVASFDVIKAQAAAATNPDQAFSEHCLYYSIAENALMKYNKTTHTFVLINDLTDVKADIQSNAREISKNASAISGLDTEVTGEITRAKDAEKALSDRIDALTGGDGATDSLDKLRQALNEEISARTTADEGHSSAISALNGTTATHTEEIEALQVLVGELPTGVTGSIVQYIDSKVLEEKNRALGIEGGLRTDVNANAAEIADVSDALTTETARAEAAEEANAAAAANAQTTADNAAKAASDEATRATEAEGVLRTSITNLTNTYNADKQELDNQITGISTRLSTVEKTAGDAKTQSDTNKAGLAQEIKDRTAGDTANKNAIDKEVQDRQDEVTRLEGLIGDASAAAAAVQKNLDDEAKTRAAEDQKLQQGINTVAQSVTTEAKAREDADAELQGQITTASEAITTAEGKISALETDMGTAKNNIKDLDGRVAALNTAIETEQSTRAQAVKTLTDNLNTEATKREEEDGKLAASIAKETTDREQAISDALDAAAADAKSKDDALLELINENMAAANSMTFKGSVTGGYASLPASGIQAGDTYVVTESFGLGEDDPQVGDLLVASADQADGDSLADANAKKDFFIWVKTGYSTFNDPQLVVEDAKIKMKSHLGEVLGTVTVTSASENIVTSITGSDKDCTVNVSFVWGTF